MRRLRSPRSVPLRPGSPSIARAGPGRSRMREASREIGRAGGREASGPGVGGASPSRRPREAFSTGLLGRVSEPAVQKGGEGGEKGRTTRILGLLTKEIN